MIKNSDITALPALRAGDMARVVKIRGADNGRLLKLSSLGLVPGSLICLQQRWPAYIIWVGETQLSLEEEVARDILLQKL